MEYIENSQEITGFKVKIIERHSFRVRGYTLIVQPGKRGAAAMPRFWDEVAADGRLKRLREASSVAFDFGFGADGGFNFGFHAGNTF